MRRLKRPKPQVQTSVGMDDLAEQIKGGMMDFDVVIASPDAMRVVGQLGQVLGPARPRCPTPRPALLRPTWKQQSGTPRPARCDSAPIKTASSMAVSAKSASNWMLSKATSKQCWRT